MPAAAFLLTGAAVTAFAANSLLCRLALHDDEMDPIGFTVVRLCSAALVLTVLMRVRTGNFTAVRSGNWASALSLFTYAIAFSYAYVALETGTGALLLFGAVQVTMISIGLLTGERPPAREWAGLVLALSGLVYLLLPGAEAPDWLPAASMIAAGIAWGLYSLRGRGSKDPGAATCGNFIRTLPMILLVGLIYAAQFRATTNALLAALASGAIASGLGYVVWYAALKHLTATRAAIVQLLSPVLATLSGVAFLHESLTSRIVIAAIAGFSGVALAATARRED